MATPQAKEALAKAFKDTIQSLVIREFFMNEGEREQEKVRSLEYREGCLKASIEKLELDLKIKTKMLQELDNGIITSQVLTRVRNLENKIKGD